MFIVLWYFCSIACRQKILYCHNMLSFYTVHRFALSLSLKMHRVCFGSCCRVWRCVLKQMPPDILKIAYKQLQVVSQYAFLMILANQPPNYSCQLSLLKAWCYLVVRCIARCLDIFGRNDRTKIWNIIRIDLKHSQIQVLPNLTSQLRTVHPFKAFSCHVSKRIVFTFPASQCFTGQGITGNTVWPATVIESQAINFGHTKQHATSTKDDEIYV